MLGRIGGVNNSIILNTEDAPDAVAKMLRRFGLDEATVQNIRRSLHRLSKGNGCPCRTTEPLSRSPAPNWYKR